MMMFLGYKMNFTKREKEEGERKRPAEPSAELNLLYSDRGELL